MAWLRLYDDIVHDPKIMMLPAVHFRSWVLCLCMAKEKEGLLPPIEHIAFQLRMTQEECKAHIEALTAANLIDRDDEELRIHAWDKRQFVSDMSYDRVKKYRAARKESGLTTNGYQKHRAEVLERDGHCCRYCRSTDRLVLDHVVPIIRGGTDDVSNLVTACKRCNSKKAGRLLHEAQMTLLDPDTVTVSVTACHRDTTVTPPLQSRLCHGDTPLLSRSRVTPDTDTDTDTESESESDALDPQQLFGDLAKDICQRLPLGGDPQLTLTCLQHEYRNSASFLGRPAAFVQSISRRLTLWADAYRADPFLARQAKAGQWWLKNGIYALDPPSGGHTQTGKKSLTQLALEHLAAKENNHAH